MKKTLIQQATIINEGTQKVADLLIEGDRIARIDGHIPANGAHVINGENLTLLPGVIDDQVHFREPGLTHKASIGSEAKAAVAGGVTSFMEMPNTKPPAFTQKLLEDKYEIAAHTSLANYSFYMGASNDNTEELLKTNPAEVCGIKVFMGSSTGNLLVDDEEVLSGIFEKSHMLVATHCEVEGIVRRNEQLARDKYGDDVPMDMHPVIRSVEACFKSSEKAVQLAKMYNTRLHILHISTANELDLFDNTQPLEQKRITAEACVHHLWFDAGDYANLGTKIKCNPAIKATVHKKAVLQGLLEDKLDVIATDHAPHTWAEKQNKYFEAPSGVPLVQHSLLMMLEMVQQGKITMEKVVEKMCHAPAVCFKVKDRGYIREGQFADLVLVDLERKTQVFKNNLYYKCGWSPFEGHTFPARITHTFVSGHPAYVADRPHCFDDTVKGQRLLFNN